jgi:hypothetical protein
MVRSGRLIAPQAESADSRMELLVGGGSDAKELDAKISNVLVLCP